MRHPAGAGAGVRFRHEIARQVVESSLSDVERTAAHARVLATLRAMDAEPSRLVHHAMGARDHRPSAGALPGPPTTRPGPAATPRRSRTRGWHCGMPASRPLPIGRGCMASRPPACTR